MIFSNSCGQQLLSLTGIWFATWQNFKLLVGSSRGCPNFSVAAESAEHSFLSQSLRQAPWTGRRKSKLMGAEDSYAYFMYRILPSLSGHSFQLQYLFDCLLQYQGVLLRRIWAQSGPSTKWTIYGSAPDFHNINIERSKCVSMPFFRRHHH